MSIILDVVNTPVGNSDLTAALDGNGLDENIVKYALYIITSALVSKPSELLDNFYKKMLDENGILVLLTKCPVAV